MLPAYSHNGLADVHKRFLHKLADAVDLPGSDDEVLGLVILQHQPHSLEREAEPREVALGSRFGNTGLSPSDADGYPQKAGHEFSAISQPCRRSRSSACLRRIPGLLCYICLGLAAECGPSRNILSFISR